MGVVTANTDGVFSRTGQPLITDYSPTLTNQGPTFAGTPTDGSDGGPAAFAASAPAPAPDPYAAWGGQTAYNNLVSGFNTQDQTIHSTSDAAAQNTLLGNRASVLDYLDTLGKGQRSIDESGVQNELAKKQGMNSILDMISHGIRSGGVLLANRNASNSSAAEAIARAYGDIGRRQGNQVGNQYEQGNRKIGLAQADLESGKALQRTKYDLAKQQSVGGIVASAQAQLANLDAQIASANLPNRIAIEQEKAQIQASVQNILNGEDAHLNSGIDAVKAQSPDANRAAAAGLATAGTAATSPFDLTSAPPAQFAGSGPFASELPLFTSPRKRTA